MLLNHHPLQAPSAAPPVLPDVLVINPLIRYALSPFPQVLVVVLAEVIAEMVLAVERLTFLA